MILVDSIKRWLSCWDIHYVVVPLAFVGIATAVVAGAQWLAGLFAERSRVHRDGKPLSKGEQK